MDEISWFNNDYSDMFSLEFDNLFSTIDFESFESTRNYVVSDVFASESGDKNVVLAINIP